MDLTLEINAVKDLVTQSTKIVLLLPHSANRDILASALALSLSLIKLQKEVHVAYPGDPTVSLANLVGVNKLTKKLGNKNIVISLDYVEGSIEKVSYNIAGNKFNLVIEPKIGAPVFDEKKVTFNRSGFITDLIITFGVTDFTALGKYYSENTTLFQEKPVITIANTPSTQNLGKVNLMLPTTTVAEIVANILKNCELPVDSDIASNLYDGIVSGSDNFTKNQVGPDTLEAGAWCLRQGARKKTPQISEEKPFTEVASSGFPDKPQTPPDWLKPKIYKGGSLL